MDLQNHQQKMQKIDEDRYPSPSFNSYSSDRLAELAAKISDEFKREQFEFIAQEGNYDEEDGEFEFSLVPEHSEVLADDFGQIVSVFPVFNRDLLLHQEDDKLRAREAVADRSARDRLRNLFVEENEEDLESSSSENDELEAVPPGTYCVWRPKRNETETKLQSFPSEVKKSNSTGSGSKRWKLRDLLRRINSDGNDSYVFLTPKKAENSKSKDSSMVLKLAGKTKPKKSKAAAAPSSTAVHEAFYLRNKAAKEGEKRKSYLPYRRDLVGFFANVNGFPKSFRPIKCSNHHHQIQIS